MDMYFLKEYYFDYDCKIPKQLNHIQSKYTKMRDCLESGKMSGNGSDIARAYKVWIETIISYDGINNEETFDKEKKYDIGETLECFGLSHKYFTGRYYKGDFKNIPEFYTLKKLPVEKKEFTLLEKKEIDQKIHKIKEEHKNKKIIQEAKKNLEKKKEEKKPEKKPEKKKEKIKIEEKKEEIKIEEKKEEIKIEEKKEEKKEISEQDEKFLKQIESVKNKCNIQEEKNNAMKDKILNTEIDFTDMKKQYHRNCHMNNQLSLFLEMNPKDLREKLKRLNEDMENKILEAEQKLSEA